MQHSANIGVPPRALAKAPTGIQGLDEITNGEEIASDVASLGFDLPALVDEGKLFIDYVRIERSEIEEAGEYDLEGLFVRLDHAIRSTGAKRIVLDSLESLFSGPSNANILRAELRRLFRWLKDKGLTAGITAERGEGTLARQGLEEYRTTACVSQMQEDDDMQQSLPTETNPDTFVLRLYIAGQTPKCTRAFSNLERVCEQYLTNRYRIEMIDLPAA
jgi:hypothetical protein